MRLSAVPTALFIFYFLGLTSDREIALAEEKAKDKQKAARIFEFGFEPSEEPPTILTPNKCEIRSDETEAFSLFYRNDRLALKIRKNSEVPLCYLYGPDGIFAIVALNRPRSPSISTHGRPNLDIVIETRPDKSLELVAFDGGDPNGFFESYILTSSTVTLLSANEYAKRVNELRTLASTFQFYIRKKDEN